jgi:hypothetical protein
MTDFSPSDRLAIPSMMFFHAARLRRAASSAFGVEVLDVLDRAKGAAAAATPPPDAAVRLPRIYVA